MMYNLLLDSDIEIQDVDDEVVGRSSGNAWLRYPTTKQLAE